MGYEVIPVNITKYVMSAKEIAKFFNKEKKWYTYATRIPLPGEMIRVNGETRVISDGCAIITLGIIILVKNFINIVF